MTERKQKSSRSAKPALVRKKKNKTPSRVFPRADFPGRVYVHDADKLYIAPLINISASGIFVKDITSIPCGTEVKLVIKSPSLARSIQARGDVVRVEKGKNRHGLAVHFTDIASDTKSVIEKSVEVSHLDGTQELLREIA